jgi:hypothetical protein
MTGFSRGKSQLPTELTEGSRLLPGMIPHGGEEMKVMTGDPTKVKSPGFYFFGRWSEYFDYLALLYPSGRFCSVYPN